MGKQNRKTISVLGFVGWLVLCFGVSLSGVMFPPGDWYAQLRKPLWNPPNWIFAPVWTALYAMMALAAWQVWRRHEFSRTWPALGIFLLQLFLNALWSLLFFGLHAPGWALVEIGLLWLAIFATVRAFHRLDALAAWLLVPYWAWVSFAVALNAALWILNRS